MPLAPRLLLLVLVLSSFGCEDLSKLVQDEPTKEQQARALIVRAQKLAAAGDHDNAVSLFERASALNPRDPSPQLALAELYSKQGNDGQAILALKRAVDLAPDDTAVRSELADLYLRHGKTDAAAEQLKRALEGAEQPDPAVQRKLATAYLRGGRLDEAEEIADKLYKSDAADAENLAVYAEVLVAKGQEERAVRLLDAAVESAGDSPRVRMARAKYFYSRGKVSEALHEFDLAQKAAPDDPEIALSRARALATAKRFDDASEAIDSLAASRPNDLNVQAVLAEIKLLTGDVATAQDAAENILSRQPRNARALYVRARAIEQNSGAEDVDRAINAYRAVIDVDGNQADALSRLWRLYTKDGKKSDAISTLERLVMLGEATSDDELELASLYAQTGMNVPRGQKMVAEALKRDPENERLLKVKKDLDAKAKETRAVTGFGGNGGGGVQMGAPGGGIQIMKHRKR